MKAKCITITDHQVSEIEKMAKKLDISFSDMLRRLLEKVISPKEELENDKTE